MNIYTDIKLFIFSISCTLELSLCYQLSGCTKGHKYNEAFIRLHILTRNKLLVLDSAIDTVERVTLE